MEVEGRFRPWSSLEEGRVDSQGEGAGVVHWAVIHAVGRWSATQLRAPSYPTEASM